MTYHNEEAEIELVADPALKDAAAEEYWYVREFGGGVLIREPKVFGRVFLSAGQIEEDEDLKFVSRETTQPSQLPENG